MSFYLRPISNKFTSFVNVRKQATDINYQLLNNIKSSLFLDEVSHDYINNFRTIIVNRLYLYDIFNCHHIRPPFQELVLLRRIT